MMSPPKFFRWRHQLKECCHWVLIFSELGSAMENGEWFSLETEAEWKITAWEGVVSIAQFSTALEVCRGAVYQSFVTAEFWC